VAHVFGYAINPFPLLMTITMFIQMQLQPKPPVVDENQQMQMKIMKFMPFMFLIFCYSYASALALYWTVQNIISIFQTQLVKRMPEAQLVKRDLTKLPSVSGANRFGGPAEPEKPKGPAQPRIGGTGKSAFKK
jgi:YidC/Oxa1 family membrane protein insertase